MCSKPLATARWGSLGEHLVQVRPRKSGSVRKAVHDGSLMVHFIACLDCQEKVAQAGDSGNPIHSNRISCSIYFAQQLVQQVDAHAHSPPMSQLHAFASHSQTSQEHASPQHEQGATWAVDRNAPIAKGVAISAPTNIATNNTLVIMISLQTEFL